MFSLDTLRAATANISFSRHAVSVCPALPALATPNAAPHAASRGRPTCRNGPTCRLAATLLDLLVLGLFTSSYFVHAFISLFCHDLLVQTPTTLCAPHTIFSQPQVCATMCMFFLPFHTLPHTCHFHTLSTTPHTMYSSCHHLLLHFVSCQTTPAHHTAPRCTTNTCTPRCGTAFLPVLHTYLRFTCLSCLAVDLLRQLGVPGRGLLAAT